MAKRKTPTVKSSSSINWEDVYLNCETWAKIVLTRQGIDYRDVLQDAYIALSQSSATPDNQQAYFKVTCYNIMRKMLRAKPELPQLGTGIQDKVLIEEIYLTIQHLPEFERRIFEICEINGVPIKTASNLTNIPTRTMYDALNRAKVFIRSNFTDVSE